MQAEPNIFPYKDFELLLSKKRILKLDAKSLSGGIQAVHYFMIGATTHFIAVNKTIYELHGSVEAYSFFDNMKIAPAGTVQHSLPIDCKELGEPLDLQYRSMTYDFFYSVKLCREQFWMKVLSELILNDGRVSVLYSNMRIGVGEDPQNYYLVIGRLVFSHWRVEPLIKLEAAINDGSATYWRPELTGTMDYIPVYLVSDYTTRHHKYTTQSGLIKTCDLPDGSHATVYTFTQKNPRFYLRAWDKIYSFASLSDCEIILDRLTKSVPPAESTINKDKILKHAQVIAARRNRYINADLDYWTFRPQIKVSETGSLIVLNTGLI